MPSAAAHRPGKTHPPPQTPQASKQSDGNALLVDTLRQQYENAKAVDASLQAANIRLMHEAEQAKKDLEDIRTTLTNELKACAARVASLEAKLAATNTQHAAIIATRDAELASMRASLAHMLDQQDYVASAAAQHAQLQEQNRQLEQQLLSTRNQLRLAQEEHAAQLSQLERTSLEQRERRERLHQEQIAAAVSRALEDGLQAHMDAATRRVLEDGARLAQEVAHARAEAARVQAQATRLQEENRRLQVLASVEQDTEAQLAARAAALSDALQGTLQQAANTEWRVLDCGAALHEASERLAAALAQAEAARQEGLVHQAEAARLAAELDASRARMAAMMQHCDAVTRFLLQCTEDLALTEGAVAGRVEGGHVVPSRLQDLSATQRSRVLHQLLDKLAVFQARAAATEAGPGLALCVTTPHQQ